MQVYSFVVEVVNDHLVAPYDAVVHFTKRFIRVVKRDQENDVHDSFQMHNVLHLADSEVFTHSIGGNFYVVTTSNPVLDNFHPYVMVEAN